MLGRVNPQGSLLDSAQLFGHLVTKGSFYESSRFVSRGMAALVAVQDVLDNNPLARLALEAVEEPSLIAGHPSPELNYVGVAPWIVLLADPHQERRYVVAVARTGK